MSIYVSVRAQSRSILNSEALSRSCDLVFIKLSPQSFSAFPLVRRIVQAQSQEYGIVYCTFILVQVFLYSRYLRFLGQVFFWPPWHTYM